MLRAFFLICFLLSFAAAARADTFVWQDPAADFTMSFPDTWRVQTGDTPGTQLRIAGPLGEDMATCRMQVRKDGRLQIYPKRLMDEAVVETLNKNYWDQETGQYKNAQITDYYAPASLGSKGDATAIRVSFQQDDGTGKMVPMHGIMIGSIYGDNIYVASCSARHDMYDRYASLFGSIVDSVELKSKYHPFATGYDRNFLMDPKLSLPRVKPGTINPEPGIVKKLFGDQYHTAR